MKNPATRFSTILLLVLFHPLGSPWAETTRERPRPPGGYEHVKGLLQKVVIPEFGFKEWAPSQVFNFLSQMTRESQVWLDVNMVCLWSADEGRDLPPLSMELKNISVWDAYLAACELAGLQLRVERNIVLLSKAKPPEVPEAPPILTGPRFDSKIERDMEATSLPEIRYTNAELTPVLDHLYRQASERNPEAFPRVHPQDAASGRKEHYVTVFGVPPSSPDRENPRINIELYQSSLLDIFQLSLHLSGLSYRVVDNRIELFETR